MTDFSINQCYDPRHGTLAGNFAHGTEVAGAVAGVDNFRRCIRFRNWMRYGVAFELLSRGYHRSAGVGGGIVDIPELSNMMEDGNTLWSTGGNRFSSATQASIGINWIAHNSTLG